MPPVGELLAPLRRLPARSGVMLDFDGTLAPIVDDPAEAAPLQGISEALRDLADRYGLVAVVSGRPVAFLAAHVPETVVVTGLYGLEALRAGQRADHPDVRAWRPVVAGAARRADAQGPDGMVVEDKGLSLTLHYRTHPEAAGDVRAWAQAEGARAGLEVRPAKMSVELHPPVAVDKGTAVDALSDGMDAVCFVGDDVGDLPAFDALDRIAARGGHAVRVAVASREVDERLIARADLVVDGPAGVLDLLLRL